MKIIISASFVVVNSGVSLPSLEANNWRNKSRNLSASGENVSEMSVNVITIVLLKAEYIALQLATKRTCDLQ